VNWNGKAPESRLGEGVMRSSYPHQLPTITLQ